MNVYYDTMPPVMEAVGNGSYRYRWNIRKEEVEDPAADGEEKRTRVQWNAQEATVWMPLTPNRITAAVIKEAWAPDYEQKLLNEFNAATLGMLPAEEAENRKTAYTEFLRQRASLKEEIDEFCAEHGIR